MFRSLLLEWVIFLRLRASQTWLCEHSQPLHGHQSCQQVQRVQEHQRVQGRRELQQHRSHHALPMEEPEPGNGGKISLRKNRGTGEEFWLVLRRTEHGKIIKGVMF